MSRIAACLRGCGGGCGWMIFSTRSTRETVIWSIELLQRSECMPNSCIVLCVVESFGWLSDLPLASSARWFPRCPSRPHLSSKRFDHRSAASILSGSSFSTYTSPSLNHRHHPLKLTWFIDRFGIHPAFLALTGKLSDLPLKDPSKAPPDST